MLMRSLRIGLLASLLLLASVGALADASAPAAAAVAPALKPQSTQGHPILIDLLKLAPPPAYALKCGSGYCDTRRSYCETVSTDEPHLPNDYACRPLPAACAHASNTAQSCGCFPAHTKCDFCSTSAVGAGVGFYRTCFGGG